MVPGAAPAGLVGPMVLRTISTALFASQAIATAGPEVMKFTKAWEEGPVHVFPVVTMGQALIHLQELHAHQLEAPPFEPANYFSDQAPLHAVRFYQYQSLFHSY